MTERRHSQNGQKNEGPALVSPPPSSFTHLPSSPSSLPATESRPPCFVASLCRRMLKVLKEEERGRSLKERGKRVESPFTGDALLKLHDLVSHRVQLEIARRQTRGGSQPSGGGWLRERRGKKEAAGSGTPIIPLTAQIHPSLPCLPAGGGPGGSFLPAASRLFPLSPSLSESSSSSAKTLITGEQPRSEATAGEKRVKEDDGTTPCDFSSSSRKEEEPDAKQKKEEDTKANPLPPPVLQTSLSTLHHSRRLSLSSSSASSPLSKPNALPVSRRSFSSPSHPPGSLLPPPVNSAVLPGSSPPASRLSFSSSSRPTPRLSFSASAPSPAGQTNNTGTPSIEGLSSSSSPPLALQTPVQCTAGTGDSEGLGTTVSASLPTSIPRPPSLAGGEGCTREEEKGGEGRLLSKGEEEGTEKEKRSEKKRGEKGAMRKCLLAVTPVFVLSEDEQSRTVLMKLVGRRMVSSLIGMIRGRKTFASIGLLASLTSYLFLLLAVKENDLSYAAASLFGTLVSLLLHCAVANFRLLRFTLTMFDAAFLSIQVLFFSLALSAILCSTMVGYLCSLSLFLSLLLDLFYDCHPARTRRFAAWGVLAGTLWTLVILWVLHLEFPKLMCASHLFDLSVPAVVVPGPSGGSIWSFSLHEFCLNRGFTIFVVKVKLSYVAFRHPNDSALIKSRVTMRAMDVACTTKVLSSSPTSSQKPPLSPTSRFGMAPTPVRMDQNEKSVSQGIFSLSTFVAADRNTYEDSRSLCEAFYRALLVLPPTFQLSHSSSPSLPLPPLSQTSTPLSPSSSPTSEDGQDKGLKRDQKVKKSEANARAGDEEGMLLADLIEIKLLISSLLRPSRSSFASAGAGGASSPRKKSIHQRNGSTSSAVGLREHEEKEVQVLVAVSRFVEFNEEESHKTLMMQVFGKRFTSFWFQKKLLIIPLTWLAYLAFSLLTFAFGLGWTPPTKATEQLLSALFTVSSPVVVLFYCSIANLRVLKECFRTYDSAIFVVEVLIGVLCYAVIACFRGTAICVAIAYFISCSLLVILDSCPPQARKRTRVGLCLSVGLMTTAWLFIFFRQIPSMCYYRFDWREGILVQDAAPTTLGETSWSLNLYDLHLNRTFTVIVFTTKWMVSAFTDPSSCLTIKSRMRLVGSLD